jgi:hypothetical protein
MNTTAKTTIIPGDRARVGDIFVDPFCDGLEAGFRIVDISDGEPDELGQPMLEFLLETPKGGTTVIFIGCDEDVTVKLV